MSDPVTPQRMKGVGRVTFLKHRAEIEAELNEGWPLKAIYQKRQAALGFSYQHFVRYVNAIIRSAPAPSAFADPSPPPPEPAAPRPRLNPGTLAQKDETNAGLDNPGRSFAYNPNPSPADRAKLIGNGSKDK